MGRNELAMFFEPSSIAIIGSLGEEWFGGQVLRQNLLDNGYSGGIYLINPSLKEISGARVYPNIKAVSETIDLAVIMVPSQRVPQTIQDCAEKGISAAIIVPGGFSEAGKEGDKLQNEVDEVAKCTGTRILGPNCLGVTNTEVGLMTFPFRSLTKVKKGGVAVGSQSGVISPPGLPWGDMGCGVSKTCDFGNKCDVDEADFLEFLRNDQQSEAIALHLEGLRDGRRFLEIAREVAAIKPIFVYKPGRTQEGAKAAMSHTGSLAGEQKVYEAAFKQAGIIQVNSLMELFEIAKSFPQQPLPKGNRVAIVTLTGGAGVISIDGAVESGLVLAKLSAKTNRRLTQLHPTLVGNPLDIEPAGAALGHLPVKETLEAVLNDENVDCVIANCWTSTSTEQYVEAFSKIKNHSDKPTVFWVFGSTLESIAQLRSVIEHHGYPAYSDLETAAKVLGIKYQYTKIQTKLREEKGQKVC